MIEYNHLHLSIRVDKHYDKWKNIRSAKPTETKRRKKKRKGEERIRLQGRGLNSPDTVPIGKDPQFFWEHRERRRRRRRRSRKRLSSLSSTDGNSIESSARVWIRSRNLSTRGCSVVSGRLFLRP